MIDSVILLLVGLFVGFFGTIVGVGGGLIVVPLLTIVYHFSPQNAVGTSMCIVALNALSGSLSYAKQKRIDYRTGIVFGLSTLPGAFFGAYLLQLVSKKAFDIGFAIFLFIIATYMMLRPKQEFRTDAASILTFKRPNYNKFLGILISFGVGFVASMAGIGGGIIHVPAMIYLFHFHPFIAVPTSHFILAISAVFASFSHASIGEVEWGFVPSLGLGAILGAQLGGTLSHRLKTIWILRGLLIAIVLAGLRLIMRNM